MPERYNFMTKSTSVAPAPGMPAAWLAFLHDATGGDTEFQRYIHQICGYCLTGDVSEHALFFIYGPGGNGKSVFLNTVTNIFGDFAKTAPVDIFLSGKGDRHPTELAMLRGARLVAVSETEEGRPWKENLIKQLTGGDKLTARFMRQDFFTYAPQFKLVIIGNHKPRLRNVDEAMRRRIHILPFTQTPANPDKHLEEKLRAEYPQILNWMIDGAKNWQANGFHVPAVVRNATDEYFAAQDLFGQWLGENCDTVPGNSTAATMLFNNWKDYAERRGEHPGNVTTFADNLTKRGFEKRKTSSANVYDGLSLKNNNPTIPAMTGGVGALALNTTGA